MKIIIVGCGKVGVTLAQQLSQENHDVTLIDRDEKRLSAATERADVMGVLGNGAMFQVQMEAGVRSADLMIATTESDEMNLLCCMIARKAGNYCHTIARVRDPEYIADVNYIKEELNLAMVINPELAAAQEVARLLKFPSAIKIEPFAKGRIELLKFAIPEGSVLAGLSVMDVVTRLRANVLICTVERGKSVTIPDGKFMLQSLDKVSFIASHHDAMAFFEQAGIVNNMVRSIMIVGGGRIAYYIAKALQGTKMRIKIIEMNRDRCKELSELLPKVVVINGDASDQQLLLEEGIEQTEAFAAVTGLDEENIMLSLYAGSRSHAKLITKVTKISFEDVVNSLNLGSILCPKQVIADNILRYVRAMQNSYDSEMETLYKIVAGKAEALEFRVREPSEVTDVPLEKLQLKRNLIVAAIIRNNQKITPRGQDEIRVGDKVIIVTTHMGLNKLNDILL